MVLGNVERNEALRALVRYSIKKDEKHAGVECGIRAATPPPAGRSAPAEPARLAHGPAEGSRSDCRARTAGRSAEPDYCAAPRRYTRTECDSSSASAGPWSSSVVFALASYFAVRFGTGGLWRGLEPALAVAAPGQPKAPYDLTQLDAVNETLEDDPRQVRRPDARQAAGDAPVARSTTSSATSRRSSSCTRRSRRRVKVRVDTEREGVPRRQRAGPLGRGGAPARGLRASCRRT